MIGDGARKFEFPLSLLAYVVCVVISKRIGGVSGRLGAPRTTMFASVRSVNFPFAPRRRKTFSTRRVQLRSRREHGEFSILTSTSYSSLRELYYSRRESQTTCLLT